ncbi:type II secretion system minor pseudopilin GspJ [Marinagarivorans algicola]|uniref:type II secretion system minor pseudopilin GspJ n=1 Tax=Marinagarivorans algicola TaxID=1513270 RepID=UPI00138F0345|nr:type II secretion system minor pseudopilin GspJ [Marinagarivorans algicola]
MKAVVCYTRLACHKSVQRGFTLIEVMIAIVIMAMIAVMTSQSFTAAISSSEATQEAIARLAAVDRVWVLLETDLRNAVPAIPKVQGRNDIPPLYVDPSEEYRLSILRGGYANPLRLPRTEMVRVGYRFEDNVLWRDTWNNIADNDERNARPQRILEEIDDILVKALPNSNSASVTGGPWQERWPASGVRPDTTFPAAIEVTLILPDFGEIKRIYSILPGIKGG